MQQYSQHLAVNSLNRDNSTLRTAASSISFENCTEQERLLVFKEGQVRSPEAARALIAYYDLVEDIIDPQKRYEPDPLLKELSKFTSIHDLTLREPESQNNGILGKNVLEALQREIFNKDTWPEKVYSIEEVAKMYSVATKTVRRWKDYGYIKPHLFIGLQKGSHTSLGLSEYQLSEAEEKYGNKIKQASSPHINKEEGERIKARCHELLENNPSASITHTLNILSREFSRSRESLRKLTRNFIRSIQKSHIENMLAVLEEAEIHFFDNPNFKDPRNKKKILAPTPPGKRNTIIPDDIPTYLKELYQYDVLTCEQEYNLFKKMNYQKYLADKIYQREKKRAYPILNQLKKAALYLEDAKDTRNIIIEHNLRLVVSIAKRNMSNIMLFDELLSNGNLKLERAVEKFDFNLGNKFSVYATSAIQRDYIRKFQNEARFRSRYKTNLKIYSLRKTEERVNELKRLHNAQELEKKVKELILNLDDREAIIVKARHAIGEFSRPHTLKEIGEMFHVTKERIRQLNSRAEEKLKTIISSRREHQELLDLLPNDPTLEDLFSKAFQESTPS